MHMQAMAGNPITRNARWNTGTPRNPMPVPINPPHLRVRARFFAGTGTGSPKKFPTGRAARDE